MSGEQLLILGASGGVGRCLVQQALERGHPVRALVRPSSSYAAPVGAETIRGQVLEEGVLAEAAAGSDVVLSALGHRRANPIPYSPLRSPPDLNERVARALVQAEVARFIGVSAAGVGDSFATLNPAMKLLIRTSTIGYAYRDLEQMEAILSRSEVDWTLPRPVTLTNGPRTGEVREVEAFAMTSIISRADVAGWMLDHLDGHPSRTPMLAH